MYSRSYWQFSTLCRAYPDQSSKLQYAVDTFGLDPSTITAPCLLALCPFYVHLLLIFVFCSRAGDTVLECRFQDGNLAILLFLESLSIFDWIIVELRNMY